MAALMVLLLAAVGQALQAVQLRLVLVVVALLNPLVVSLLKVVVVNPVLLVALHRKCPVTILHSIPHTSVVLPMHSRTLTCPHHSSSLMVRLVLPFILQYHTISSIPPAHEWLALVYEACAFMVLAKTLGYLYPDQA